MLKVLLNINIILKKSQHPLAETVVYDLETFNTIKCVP